jgi:hypothetical protein
MNLSARKCKKMGNGCQPASGQFRVFPSENTLDYDRLRVEGSAKDLPCGSTGKKEATPPLSQNPNRFHTFSCRLCDSSRESSIAATS